MKKIVCIALSLFGARSLDASVPRGVVKVTSGIFANGGQIRDIKIDSSGRILACGYTIVGGQNRWTVARFTSEGFLDTNFNSPNGYQQVSVNGSFANGLAIQADGKIVVVGLSNSNPSIARYNTNGSIDVAVRAISTGFVENAVAVSLDNTSTQILISSFRANGSPFFNITHFNYVTAINNLTTFTAVQNGPAGALNGASINACVGSVVTKPTSNQAISLTTNPAITTTPFLTLNSPYTSSASSGFAASLNINKIVAQTDNVLLMSQWRGDIHSLYKTTNGGITGGTTFNVLASDVGTFPYNTGGGLALTADTLKVLLCAATTALSEFGSPQPFISKLVVSDGSFDNTFGSSGKTIQTQAALTPGFYAAVGLQSDGKAVVGGFTTASVANGEWILARYTTAGVLDTTFGSLVDPTGLFQDNTLAPFNAGVAGLILTTTIDQAGKLVVGGYYGINAMAARYNVASSPVRDNTFDSDGALLLASLATTSSLNKIINAESGAYLAVGQANNLCTTVKLTNVGALDTTTFNPPNGFVTESSVGVSAAYDMLLNGTALAVSGFTNTNIPSVINYNASTGVRNSALGDNGLQQFSNFGTGIMYGIQTTTGTKRYGAGQASSTAFVRLLGDNAGLFQDAASPFNTGANGVILSTVIDPSGKLVVGGYYGSNAMAARYNVASSPVRDNSFDTDGALLLTSLATASSLNKIVTAGTGYLAAGQSNNQLTSVKITNAGALDASYGDGGVVQETMLGTSTGVSVVINSDGTLVVGGQSTVSGVLLPTLISYTATGTKIPTFGTGGVQTYNNFGVGIWNDLIAPATGVLTTAGQTGSIATLMAVGQSNELVNQLNNGF